MSDRTSMEELNTASIVIFDADGTLRRTIVPGQPCPHAPGEWELMPGVADVLCCIDWRRVRFAIASNQDHVGYGLLSHETALGLFRDLARIATGGRALAPIIRFCTHRLEERCECRKPEPGMILDILRTTSIEPRAALFVGDSVVDEAAARAARTPFRWAKEVFGWA